jgi:hypothetical protein
VDLRDELGRRRRIEDRGEKRVRRRRIKPTEVDPMTVPLLSSSASHGRADGDGAARQIGRS